MGRTIDYEQARAQLVEAFESAENDYRAGESIDVSPRTRESTKKLFESKTQAFREALVGCCLGRLSDPDIDIRLPYMNQGKDAYNGRTLDEKVVNPFLREREIPISTNPFLSSLRRNVSLVPETAKGLRDKEAFFAMLSFIEELRRSDQEGVRKLLRILLSEFVALRDRSAITLSHVKRLSMEQHGVFLDRLLTTPSGGLLPVILTVAAFKALAATYELPWIVDWQGINVADAARGAGGDITVSKDGQTVISVEVTERPIDQPRVRSTYTTKILPYRIDDYFFFYSQATPEDEAQAIAKTYFASGHEINFVSIREWILTILTTLGTSGRSTFTEITIELLEQREIPAAIKVAWNDHLRAVVI